VIKTILKLAVAALIANATWRVGSAYVAHYRFTDAVQQLTQFRGGRTDNEVRNRMFELAAQYDIPIDEDTLTLTRQEGHTIVDGEYKRPIQLVPGYTYDWPFSIHIDTFVIDGGRD
jgi:hypothetical protein